MITLPLELNNMSREELSTMGTTVSEGNGVNGALLMGKSSLNVKALIVGGEIKSTGEVAVGWNESKSCMK